VAIQVERLSSNDTNKVAQSPRMSVSGPGRLVLSFIGRSRNSVLATSTYQSLSPDLRRICMRWDRLTLTMMQSCASAAKLRAAGPFSQSASAPCSNTACPATSDRQFGSPPKSERERRVRKGMPSRAFSLPDAG
jgi:hypothetical protein